MTNIRIDASNLLNRSWLISGRPIENVIKQSPTFYQPKRIANSSSSAGDTVSTVPGADLEDMLFENRASLKIAVSKVAMHLSSEWREVLFRQLDTLLQLDNWEDGDSTLIEQSTFMTFLKFVIYAKPSRLPSLGVSVRGHLLVAWSKNGEHLSIEYLPNDQATLSLHRLGSRSNETIAWRGHIADLKLFIERNSMTDYLQV